MQWLARLPGTHEIRGSSPGRGMTDFRTSIFICLYKCIYIYIYKCKIGYYHKTFLFLADRFNTIFKALLNVSVLFSVQLRCKD